MFAKFICSISTKTTGRCSGFASYTELKEVILASPGQKTSTGAACASAHRRI